MTDKFTICNMGLNGSFIKKNGKIMDIERVVYLLNDLSDENEQLKQAYNDAKKDVEKKEQILKNIMKDNLLIQDMRKELEE